MAAEDWDRVVAAPDAEDGRPFPARPRETRKTRSQTIAGNALLNLLFAFLVAVKLGISMGGARALSLATIDVLEQTGRAHPLTDGC